MKKILVALLAVTAFWRGNAAEADWLTDLPAAEAQAKAEHKIVLMDFTGSDWCPGCIQLKKEVFDSSQFQKYAAQNVVLVKVDFPEKKDQSKKLKETNAALQDRYKIEGFPTVVVLDKNGKEIGRQEGYEGDGPAAFIAQLEKFKSGKG